MHYFLRNYRMNVKIHHFYLRLPVLFIRSDHAGAVAEFHMPGFILLGGFGKLLSAVVEVTSYSC